MALANTMDSLNGLFKETYADKIHRLIPEGLKIYNDVEFVGKEKMPGNNYHSPVVLGQELGFTHGSQDDGAFNLLSPVAGQVKDATVRGYQIVLRTVMSYSVLARASSAGARAFETATKHIVANMIRSFGKRCEIEMMYGQDGLGIVSSVASTVITVTTASWAAGLWAGMKNMPLEVRDSAGTLRGDSVITGVDLDLRTITLQAVPSGTTSTDVLWFKGAYGNEMPGIHKIISNTGSLFGIDASQYELWKGNTYSAGSAALSFAKIQSAIAKAVEKGLDQGVKVLVNVKTWANLLNEQAALRMYDQSYSVNKTENGSQFISFFGQNGQVEIVPSIYVKEGDAFILCMDELLKVGSTDMTFKLPGSEDQFFRQLENSAGVELRAYSDFSLFAQAPGKFVLINNIVNS